MGDDIVEHTVCQSRSMWERQYGRDAPLQPEHIFQPDDVSFPHPDAAIPAQIPTPNGPRIYTATCPCVDPTDITRSPHPTHDNDDNLGSQSFDPKI